MTEDVSHITEVKHRLDGSKTKYECTLLHLEEELAVVQYNLTSEWDVGSLHLAPPIYTMALYWENRPYNVYVWYDGDDHYVASYFNIVDQVMVNRDRIEYRDLVVDILCYKDDKAEVLDREELPASISPELREYIDKTQKYILDNRDDIMEEVQDIFDQVDME
jgi:hypothetical protein